MLRHFASTRQPRPLNSEFSSRLTERHFLDCVTRLQNSLNFIAWLATLIFCVISHLSHLSAAPSAPSAPLRYIRSDPFALQQPGVGRVGLETPHLSLALRMPPCHCGSGRLVLEGAGYSRRSGGVGGSEWPVGTHAHSRGRKYAKYEDRKKGEKELDIGHRVVVLAAEKVI